MTQKAKIIYTKTDEAPALATESLLPIIQAFTASADIVVETRDISLAGRIIAHFPESLTPEQKISDDLFELGELAKTPEANIIKLPNISASIPQLKEAISELQSQGYKIPDFPEEVDADHDKEIRARYGKILGSAVNPVLREGNSDRRVAAPVKQYAKDNPHSMGVWEATSKSHIASMTHGDFYSSEKSICVKDATDVKIEFTSKAGEMKILKQSTPLLAGEVIDGSVMSCVALCEYFEKEMQDAMDKDVMLSLHLKATMMKISDPIIFGHAVKVYFKDVFAKYQSVFDELGVNVNNGLGDVYAKIQTLPEAQKSEITAALQDSYTARPKLAMVDSDKGITNLHTPSDVIIDASMPAAIRSSGKMWGADGKLHDTKSLVPDRCYAGIYQATIDFCKTHGAFDVTSMGTVSNVGLMAKKAEEYGSHDKTFQIVADGIVKVIAANGETLLQYDVQAGDIWRMCQTKEQAIKDWVKLAVNRGKATGNPAIFWLDENRAHDANLIKKVHQYLAEFELAGFESKILSPIEAIQYTLERVKNGEDTISVTGNVLRDYLTDLFPILELGTSAKMLSIVPLLAGGGLFETGAGGSAPKHVQQFIAENHLRWDSLGEFLALSAALEDLGTKRGNLKIQLLAKTLEQANGKFLKKNKSPSRKAGELDNRGSHFYLAMYWAEALAQQDEDLELQKKFSQLAKQLQGSETTILQELTAIQGHPVDLGGYYHPSAKTVLQAMRPSTTLNNIINSF